jgi:hypothetical protein
MPGRQNWRINDRGLSKRERGRSRFPHREPIGDAFHSLAASLSEPDLDRLVEEFMELACGDDMAARDEVMRLAAIEAAGTDGSQREAAATE